MTVTMLDFLAPLLPDTLGRIVLPAGIRGLLDHLAPDLAVPSGPAAGPFSGKLKATADDSAGGRPHRLRIARPSPDCGSRSTGSRSHPSSSARTRWCSWRLSPGLSPSDSSEGCRSSPGSSTVRAPSRRSPRPSCSPMTPGRRRPCPRHRPSSGPGGRARRAWPNCRCAGHRAPALPATGSTSVTSVDSQVPSPPPSPSRPIPSGPPGEAAALRRQPPHRQGGVHVPRRDRRHHGRRQHGPLLHPSSRRAPQRPVRSDRPAHRRWRGDGVRGLRSRTGRRPRRRPAAAAPGRRRHHS